MTRMCLIAIALLVQCLAFGQNLPVKITGKVIHVTANTPKVLGVNFLNPFDKARKSATIGESGDFQISGPMRFTQNMTIAYNNTFINLYVSPGDSVHLQIDAALLDQPDFEWLQISGAHAKISTQLNLLHHQISKLPHQKYNYHLPVPQMLVSVKRDYARYQAFIDHYATTHPVDPAVRAFFDRDIKFTISNWIAGYVDEGNNQTSTRLERINLFRDNFFDLSNDANFITMMYPYHLSNYFYWKVGEDTAARQDPLQGGIKLLAQEPASLSRDYILYDYVSKLIRKRPELIGSVPVVKPHFKDSAAFTALKAAVENTGPVRLPATVLRGLRYLKGNEAVALSPADLLTQLKNKYPGQVLYLDIYATWCVPCLQEMTYSPAIHRQFKGRKVTFVNLCLQSTEKDWLKLVKTKKLLGENYFLNSDDSKLLMGNFNIGGFPTYLLIDPQGKVATVNAPRPSEPARLEEAVSRLL